MRYANFLKAAFFPAIQRNHLGSAGAFTVADKPEEMSLYPNMEARAGLWQAWGADPEMKRLFAIPEYADRLIVSKIHQTFLKPLPGSMISLPGLRRAPDPLYFQEGYHVFARI